MNITRIGFATVTAVACGDMAAKLHLRLTMTISVMLADAAKPLFERRVVLKVVGHKGKAVAVLIENVAPAAHNDHQAVQLELAAA